MRRVASSLEKSVGRASRGMVPLRARTVNIVFPPRLSRNQIYIQLNFLNGLQSVDSGAMGEGAKGRTKRRVQSRALNVAVQRCIKMYLRKRNMELGKH